MTLLHRIKAALCFSRRWPGQSLLVVVLLALIGLGGWLSYLQLLALSHLRQARQAVALGHNRQARLYLDLCLGVWPKDPEVLLLAARTAWRSQVFDRAAYYLDNYFKVRGEDEALTLERVLVRAAQGDMDRVAPFCQTLVEQGHPATPLLLEALVQGYLRHFRLREAAFCLEKWLERQPDSPLALYYRGVLEEMELKRQEAVADYRHALEQDSQLDQARERLGGCLVDLTQAQEALPHLEYLARQDPDNLQVLTDLARCYDLLGRSTAAAQLLDDLLSRHPDYAPALAERGKLALRAGQLAEAESWLRRAAVRNLGDYQIHQHLALCLRQQGKEEEARRVQERLKQIEEDSKRLQEIMLHDMSLRPHDPALHYELAMLYFHGGQVAEAKRWLDSALRLDPDYAPAHQALAMYYERMGQPGRAQQHHLRAQAARLPATHP
jgi:tetratricopeptide (TPR) repeat protein